MDEQVADYFAKAKPWQRDVGDQLRKVVASTIPDHEEVFRYGKPHYLKGGKYAAVIMASKDKVSFMVFNATEIEAEKGFIRSMGNGERKTIDITEGQDVDYSKVAEIFGKTTATL